MALKNIRIIKTENLNSDEKKDINSEYAIIEIRNSNLREEFKGLPNNSISEYLHSLGDILPE